MGVGTIIGAALSGGKVRDRPVHDRPRQLQREADAKRDARDYRAAAALYQAVLDLQPSGPIHVQCGHMHKECGDLRTAEEHYLAAEALMPYDADLKLQIGHFCKVAGRLSDAAAAYHEAVILEPGWTEPLRELAALRGQGAAAAGRRTLDLADPALRTALKLGHLVDREFYFEQLDDAAAGGADALDHYRSTGWRLGLDPSPLFSTHYYVRSLHRPLDGDPLTDFALHGASELAEVHPLLDVRGYNRLSAECSEAGIHPLLHYSWRRGADRVEATRLFDTAYYLEQCPGLIEAGFSPLGHYLRFGWKEGRRPHREIVPALLSSLAGLGPAAEPLTAMLVALAAPSRAESDPVRTTVIIPNLSKPVMTLQCLFVLQRHTDMTGVEVIVVDNGSAPEHFKLLADFARHHRIVRSGVNLGFGEANNVGAEHARGGTLVFLNNDAFVTPGWLPPLLAALAEDDVGAAGPMFVYPDGRLQEAGASVNPDGHVHQNGRGLSEVHPRYLVRRDVDYISAAALAVRAELFAYVLGFDLIWDPAYYEDADLCLKVGLAGFRVLYEPLSRVCHLENTTSDDAGLNLQLGSVVGANRIKFVQRWGNYLDGRDRAAAPALLPAPPASRLVAPRPLLALFTPFPITPGGGERYLLSFAHEFRDEYDCILYTPQHTSRARILTMGRELGLHLDHVRPVRWQDAGVQPRADVFISIGNEVLPYAPPLGRRNFYVCQFPFPMTPHHYVRDWQNIEGYDGVLVYSPFVQAAYERAAGLLALGRPAAIVVAPSVPPVAGPRAAPGGPRRILNVGRFHPSGHCKRQDVMIEVFKELLAASPEPLELHLAGALGGEAVARGHFADLQRTARGLPVHFHVNGGPDVLARLYLQADIYWHATGINDDVSSRPERFEHFGITIIEAMSAGAVPVVLRHGGPGDLVEDGRSGFLARGRADLRDLTAKALKLPRAELDAMGAQARSRAAAFGPAVFKASLTRLFGA